MAQPLLTRPVFRVVLTILMYGGVCLFLFPYLAGRIYTSAALILAGAALAVLAGLSRCFLTEGDCTERDHLKQHIP